MEVDAHGQGKGDLDYAGDDHQLENEEGRSEEDPFGEKRRLNRDARTQGQGFGDQAQFDAELRGARCKVQVSIWFAQTSKAPSQRTGSRGQKWRDEGANRSDAEERELKAGVEHLLRIEQQEADGGSGQYVQQPALSVEIAAQNEQREPGRRTHGGGLPAGDQRVEPRHQRGQDERRSLRTETKAQQEEEDTGQHRDVQAGDDQAMVRAGGSEILGPDLFELGRFANQGAFQHARLIGFTLVEPLQPLERPNAEGKDRGPEV